MSYLNDFHPEIFEIRPRPGGIAKIKAPESKVATKVSSKNIQSKSSKGTLRSASRKGSRVTIKTNTTTGTFDSKFFRPTSSSSPKRTTREYRIKKILSSSPWLLFDDDEEPDNVLPPDPVHDAMTILSASISTIMLMAVNHPNIPRDHLVWTQSYLECVKDDYGNTPPNVRGIMNHIKLIDNTLTSFFDELEEDSKSVLNRLNGIFVNAPAPAPTVISAAVPPPVQPPATV